jgi:membrane fusion protein (multidrug efflux system)
MRLPFLARSSLSGLLVGASLLAFPAAALAQAPGGAPPPPAVEIMTLESRAIPLSYTYAGRISAFREVQVRAQVGGILMERAYVEGARVEAGDVLFRVDPKTYEAELAKASAQVQTAKAQLAQAQRDQARATELFERKVGSAKTRDDAVSAVELAEAAVAAASAQLQSAQINLDYATVRAPIGGVTSVDVVPEGSLVGVGTADSLLTTITQLDPVYVNFSFTDANNAEIRSIADAQKKEGDIKLTASLTFGDGSSYDRTGEIDFTSSSIDVQTGTIRSRAVFDNPDLALIPGQFVRVTITGMTLDSAIVVPEVAVLQGPQGKFVYTIDAQNVASMTPVELGQSVEGGWVVLDGLKSGDQIVTSGVIKVRPGSPVAPGAAAAPNTEAQQK